MESLWWEHKKLWRCKSTWAAVAMILFYALGAFVAYQWSTFGSTDPQTWGKYWDGYAHVRETQREARQWEGPLTEEKFQAMTAHWQQKSRAEQPALKAGKRTDACDVIDSDFIMRYFSALWPEQEDRSQGEFWLSYLDPARLTGLYARREKAVAQFLEAICPLEQDAAYFQAMEQRVQKPFSYSWTGGWRYVLVTVMSDLGLLMGIPLTIALAPVFAQERRYRMDALQYTARKGRGSVAAAKTASAFLLGTELFLLWALTQLAIQFSFLGTQGMAMPIQLIKPLATAPLSVWQAELWAYAQLFAATLGFTGIMLLLSGLCSSFAAVLLGLALLFGPVLVSGYLPIAAQKALELLPFVGSTVDTMRTNLYHVFGMVIWSPYAFLAAPPVLGAAAAIPAGLRWCRRDAAAG